MNITLMGVRINIMMPSTTVGEANAELERRSRRDLWARAVFMPLLLFAGPVVLAYATYRSINTVRTGSGPWRLLIIVSWWPYATLADVILSYMSLSLPLPPVAPRSMLFSSSTSPDSFFSWR